MCLRQISYGIMVNEELIILFRLDFFHLLLILSVLLLILILLIVVVVVARVLTYLTSTHIFFNHILISSLFFNHAQRPFDQ